MGKNVVDLRKRRPGPPPGHSIPLPLPPSRRRQRTPLREKRKRARALTLVFIIVALFVIVGAMSYVSYLPRYNIQAIRVYGARHTDSRAIQEFTQSILHDGGRHLFSKSNIFLYQPKEIEKEINAQFPWVKSSSMSRDAVLSTTANVVLTERQPFASWCLSAQAGRTFGQSASNTPATGNCFLIDENGFVIAPATASTSDAITTSYLFSGGINAASAIVGQYFAPSHLPGILALLRLLTQNNFVPLGADVINEEDFYVPLQNNFYVKASFGESAEDLVRNLQLVLSSDALQGKEDQLEYVDLRFGDRVYYKLKGETDEHQ